MPSPFPAEASRSLGRAPPPTAVSSTPLDDPQRPLAVILLERLVECPSEGEASMGIGLSWASAGLAERGHRNDVRIIRRVLRSPRRAEAFASQRVRGYRRVRARAARRRATLRLVKPRLCAGKVLLDEKRGLLRRGIAIVGDGQKGVVHSFEPHSRVPSTPRRVDAWAFVGAGWLRARVPWLGRPRSFDRRLRGDKPPFFASGCAARARPARCLSRAGRGLRVPRIRDQLPSDISDVRLRRDMAPKDVQRQVARATTPICIGGLRRALRSYLRFQRGPRGRQRQRSERGLSGRERLGRTRGRGYRQRSRLRRGHGHDRVEHRRRDERQLDSGEWLGRRVRGRRQFRLFLGRGIRAVRPRRVPCPGFVRK